jgi:hypothetical protein
MSQGARIFYEWDATVPFRLRLPQPRTALPSGGGAGKSPVRASAQSDTSGLEKGPAVTASKPPPATARRVEIHALLVDPVARAAVEADLAAGAKVDDDGVLHYVLATARTSVFVYPKREEHDVGVV